MDLKEWDLKECIENMYKDNFNKKVESNIYLKNNNVVVKHLASIILKKNSNLERLDFKFKSYQDNNNIYYVFVNDKNNIKIYQDYTKFLKLFVKKTLLKKSSYWSIKDNEFKKDLENYF